MARASGGRKTRFPGVMDLGNGRFRIRAYYTDKATGQAKEKDRVITARRVEEAFDQKRALEEELARGPKAAPTVIVAPQRKPLGDVAREWLAVIVAKRHDEDPAQPYLCPSTRQRYESTVRDFVVPFFGERFAEEITTKDVIDWRVHLVTHGYKRATVNGHLRVLKMILRSAGSKAAEGVKELNPKPDARITRKEPNLLTADELDRFLAVARERWPQHYALILVLFTTTLRLGAALALRWEDLDLEEQVVVAVRRLSEGEVIPGVKRDRFGEDVPPLMPEVHEALKGLKATYNEREAASGLLFPAADGRHHARTVLRKPFKDILKQAGITKRFTPHGCRRTGEKLYGRTAGTRMAMEIAGHKTLAMHHHYAPILADEKQAAARSAFGGLRVLDGGGTGDRAAKTGDQTGDRGEVMLAKSL